MRAHVIDHGFITNTIEVEDLEIFPNLIDAEIGGQIGDGWDGVAIIPQTENLVALKVAKNLQINEWRSAANLTSFTHNGKRIACDALSRSDIEGVAGNISLLGAFPSGFPGAWKAMDNSYIILPTIAAFKDMYASMTAQGTLNFARSQQLKTALVSAQTAQEIDLIRWET